MDYFEKQNADETKREIARLNTLASPHASGQEEERMVSRRITANSDFISNGEVIIVDCIEVNSLESS